MSWREAVGCGERVAAQEVGEPAHQEAHVGLSRNGAGRVFLPSRFEPRYRLLLASPNSLAVNLVANPRRLRVPLGATSGCLELIAFW